MKIYLVFIYLKEVQDEGITNSKLYDFTLEDEVIAYEESKKVEMALERLEDTEKDIIKGIYVNGITLKKTAADCNIEYRKAMKIKKETLRKLKEYLK